MAKKVLSVRVEDSLLKDMETLSAKLQKSQAEIVSEAIQHYAIYQRILRAGGDMVGVMNPQLIEHTEEQAKRAVEILSEAADQLTKNHPGMDFGVHYIADYAAVRLFKDSQEQKDLFEEGRKEIDVMEHLLDRQILIRK